MRPLAAPNALRKLAGGFAANAWSWLLVFTPVGCCTASKLAIMSYTRTDMQEVSQLDYITEGLHEPTHGKRYECQMSSFEQMSAKPLPYSSRILHCDT